MNTKFTIVRGSASAIWSLEQILRFHGALFFYQRAPSTSVGLNDQQASTVEPVRCSSPTNADDNRQSANSNTSPSERDDIGDNETANEDRSQGSAQRIIDDTAEEQLTELLVWPQTMEPAAHQRQSATTTL
ncbi:hypothetical protein MTO96_046379 [Rhipicephalus appendiculatus]